MLATGTTLGCGLSICVAFFAAEARAEDTVTVKPAEYRFGEWTVVVQPASATVPQAIIMPAVAIEPGPVSASRIQLTSLHQLPPAPDPVVTETPIDAKLVPQAPVVAPGLLGAVPANPCPIASMDSASRAQMYRDVYDSIPFSRAEYEANPSYRHDATMEFLFGQMRPTVINRQQRTQVDVNMPSLPYYGAGLQFNRYGIYNRWSPYMYPPYRW